MTRSAPRKPRAKLLVHAALVVAAALATGACAGSSGSEDTGSASHAIIDGTESATIHPSVGSLIDEFGGLDCTGTLIAPNVVLTAAHCFSGPSELWFQTGTFDPNKKKIEPLPSGDDAHPFAFIHPDYTENGDGTASHDLAYILLSEAVSGVTPARLASDDDGTDTCGYEVVGYGDTAPENSDGTSSATGGPRKVANICITGATDDSGLLTANGTDGSTCHRDSGGGLLEKDATGDVLVATVRGAPSGVNCGVGNDLYFTPVMTERQFIQQALTDGQDPPAVAAPADDGDDDDNP